MISYTLASTLVLAGLAFIWPANGIGNVLVKLFLVFLAGWGCWHLVYRMVHQASAIF